MQPLKLTYNFKLVFLLAPSYKYLPDDLWWENRTASSVRDEPIPAKTWLRYSFSFWGSQKPGLFHITREQFLQRQIWTNSSEEKPDKAISRKVVGKSAHDNPERYCGWFWVRSSAKKFERKARDAIDICLRVLKESKKVGSTVKVVRYSVLIISHITFRDCCVHFFCDNVSRNSCIRSWCRSESAIYNQT